MSIVILGASGAVGTQVLNTLLQPSEVQKLSILGRTPIPNLSDDRAQQHKIDIFKPSPYSVLLDGHQVAICTLGVGQPSKISKGKSLL